MNLCFAECVVDLFNERDVKQLVHQLLKDIEGYAERPTWISLLEGDAPILADQVLDSYNDKGYDACLFLQKLMIKLSEELGSLKGMRARRCCYQFQKTFASFKDGGYQYLVSSRDLAGADITLAECLFVINEQEKKIVRGDYRLLGSIYYNTDLQHYFYANETYKSGPDELRRMNIFLLKSA